MRPPLTTAEENVHSEHVSMTMRQEEGRPLHVSWFDILHTLSHHLERLQTKRNEQVYLKSQGD